jgi:hypothetical protein
VVRGWQVPALLSVRDAEGLSAAHHADEAGRPELGRWLRDAAPNPIPVISLAALLPRAGGGGGGGGRCGGEYEALAAKVGAACQEFGAFVAVDHGVDPAVTGALIAESRAFFAQPEAVKATVCTGAAERGWTPLGENLSAELEFVKQRRAILQEKFAVGCEAPPPPPAAAGHGAAAAHAKPAAAAAAAVQERHDRLRSTLPPETPEAAAATTVDWHQPNVWPAPVLAQPSATGTAVSADGVGGGSGGGGVATPSNQRPPVGRQGPVAGGKRFRTAFEGYLGAIESFAASLLGLFETALVSPTVGH